MMGMFVVIKVYMLTLLRVTCPIGKPNHVQHPVFNDQGGCKGCAELHSVLVSFVSVIIPQQLEQSTLALPLVHVFTTNGTERHFW